MEDFDDIGSEVEINPTINTNFCQCIYVIMHRFRSCDYHVTFPRVFRVLFLLLIKLYPCNNVVLGNQLRLQTMGRSILSLHYILLIQYHATK